MRSVVSLITAVSLILHLGLGCCAHHAHGHDEHAADLLTPVNDHDADEHSTADDESEGEHEGCQEPSCVYVGAAKVVLTKDLAPLATVIVANDAGTKLHHRLTPISRIETDTGPPIPIRLHLYYQILMI